MSQKFDWERVQLERRMAEQGTETIRSETSGDEIVAVRCSFCDLLLKDNRNSTEAQHLKKCEPYLRRPGIGNIGGYEQPALPISVYADSEDFPDCLVGKTIRTPNFSGHVKEVCSGREFIRIKGSGGIIKTFKIQLLLEIEEKRKRERENRSQQLGKPRPSRDSNRPRRKKKRKIIKGR